MNKYLVVLAISFLILKIGYSQTYVSGGIYSNATWTLSNSPYIITGNLTIFPGVTLTIQPGVLIKTDLSYRIDVRGNLTAIGTVTDSIIFTSNITAPIAGSWSGIYLNTPLGCTANIKYCKLEYADSGIHTEMGGNGPIIISHTVFNRDNLGYYGTTYNAAVTMDSCIFIYNRNGLCNASNFTVTNSKFVNNFQGINGADINAINCFFSCNETALNVGGGTYTNCTIINNIYGVTPTNNNNIELINSIISKNDYGILLYPGTCNITNCKICSNNIYNVMMNGNQNQNLSNNCWCSTDSTTIAAKIRDGYDNAIYGLVDFTPFNICDTTGMVNNYVCYDSSAVYNPIIVNKHEFKIYPNPFNNYTTLEFKNSNKENHNLTIYDYQGKIVQTINNITTDKIIIERNELVNGLYLFKLNADEKLIAKGKLIIE